MMLLNTTHKSFSLHALFQRIHCSTIRCPVLDDYEAAMHLSHWSSGFPNMAWPLKHGWILFVSNVKLNRASRLLIGGCCEVLRPCLPPARPIQLPVGFLHMSQEQSKEAQLPTWLLNVTVVSVVQFDSPLNLDTKSTDCNFYWTLWYKKCQVHRSYAMSEWWWFWLSLSLSSGQAFSVLIVVPMCWITHSMVQSSNPQHGIRVFCVLGSQVLSDCELALWKLVTLYQQFRGDISITSIICIYETRGCGEMYQSYFRPAVFFAPQM